jgi:toxin HigB-1
MQIKIQDRHLTEIADKNYKGKSKFPEDVVKNYRRRIAQIKEAINTNDLRKIGSLHFEKLKSKEFRDRYSIRINQGYRLIFQIEHDEISALEIICREDMNNHYA